MITLRKKDSIYRAKPIDWLTSSHHFSFGAYHDPAHMHYGALRVWNDDFIEGNSGFPMHPHKDMEIISYVVEGTISHLDSHGGKGNISAGDIQYISAGTGIQHSEMNMGTSRVHMHQLWIIPSKQGLAPKYAQYHYGLGNLKDALCPLISGKGLAGIPSLHQDATLYASMPSEEYETHLQNKKDTIFYLVCIEGALAINDTVAKAGDAVYIQKEGTVRIKALESSHYLLFEGNA